jgi:hypothetical protein
MPAKSKKQQRFFGLVKAIQEGKAHGSGKAEEVASNMSEESVGHFASTSQKGLPEKSAIDASLLATIAAMSALGGIGVGAFTGGAKEVRDATSIGETRRNKYRRRDAIPLSRRLNKEEPKADPSKMLPDNKGTESDLSEEEADDVVNDDATKQSGFGDWLSETVGELTDENVLKPALAGAALPIATLAPGVITYMLTKRFLDRGRASRMDEEVAKAKREFEQALNEPGSKLACELTEFATKCAEVNALAPAEDVSDEGLGMLGNASYYALGVPAGIGALIGWKMMQDRMGNDPERRKLKELNALLRRETTSKVIEGGLDLEDEDGNVKFKL